MSDRQIYGLIPLPVQQIRSYVDSRRSGLCSMCDAAASTRDHIPPRAFLDAPYPDNLPVVDSCFACMRAQRPMNRAEAADRLAASCSTRHRRPAVINP